MRRDPLLDHVRDAVGNDSSLAAARAGEDQERTFDRLDSFPLSWIQVGKLEMG
jgi:hypothetical protein